MTTYGKFSKWVAFILIGLLPALGLAREDHDFNFDWEFHLGADLLPLEDAESGDWEKVRLPHDWSIAQGFTKESTGASTGFLPAGVAWYRKSFTAPEDWKGDHLSLVFEGVYCRSKVYLNGKLVGGRPSGYVSFVVDLTPELRFGKEANTLLVKVDHSNYLDSRWYTGSGIYRNVRMVRTAPTRIPEWGVWVQTPEVSAEKAELIVRTEIETPNKEARKMEVQVEILDKHDAVVASGTNHVELEGSRDVSVPVSLTQPKLWDLESPNLYTAKVRLVQDGETLDDYSLRFGLRNSRFDAKLGYLLNGRRVKIKGVNLHHDAGLVGAAVPKDVWRDRLERLKSVGCNAIRMSHNPHSIELLELCDEMGFLVMDEFFDEWKVPKDKSLVWLSANKAPEEVTHGYSELFEEWAERDLKATIRRDRNHPSVIMWSIGNEIEWTYPYYPQSASYNPGDPNEDYHKTPPDFDPVKIRERMAKLHQGPDELLETAKKLVDWTHEEDPTRPATSGLVHPSVGYATGYAKALDVVGFNYRAWEYDGAHERYPEWPIIGSENWGTWAEWDNANKRDFVAGIFIWTGFAYLGEAGPWPRKGLEISLFDYAGFKTPRGHLFESMWVDKPKSWLGTTPADESEHRVDEEGNWSFVQRDYEIPAMKWLRRWEWDRIYPSWNYKQDEPIIAQAYSNCEVVELFLNGESLGQRKMAEMDDRIARWRVPFASGELKLIGSNGGKVVTEDVLRTSGEPQAIQLKVDRESMSANHYDVLRVELQLLDEKGVPVVNDDREVRFEVKGPARLLGVDNGWEKSVQPYQSDKLTTWQGRALLLLQSTDQAGEITVTAKSGEIVSEAVSVTVKP
ncbi:glycoside hydrolase family 2 TIM barrel-domain containing protein [Haloferula chungangensis]|uniref:Glycoside hydrolase family 2 TIM barrel-domain containing protein n=1 Tax=Haloferula chungangensis TaxID=1048331 RepID=A0ABW2L8N1_9BACT